VNFIIFSFLAGLCATQLYGCKTRSTAEGAIDLKPQPRLDAPLWPSYQLRADHNAVLRDSRPPVKWSYKTDGRVNGGLAYVDGTLIFDTLSGEVGALDARKGALLWRWKADTVVMSTPIVTTGTVYIGTGDNGKLGRSSRESFAYASDPKGAATIWGENRAITSLPLIDQTGKFGSPTAQLAKTCPRRCSPTVLSFVRPR